MTVMKLHLFINGEGPHFLSIVKQTMNSTEIKFEGFCQGDIDECKAT